MYSKTSGIRLYRSEILLPELVKGNFVIPFYVRVLLYHFLLVDTPERYQ